VTKFEHVCGHFLLCIWITILEWFPIDIFVILSKPNLFITQIVLKAFPQDKEKNGTSIFFGQKESVNSLHSPCVPDFKSEVNQNWTKPPGASGTTCRKITRLFQCMKLKFVTLLRTSRSFIFEETGRQRWASGYIKSFIIWLRSLILQIHVLDYSPLSELCYFLTTTSQNPKFPNKSTFKSERL